MTKFSGSAALRSLTSEGLRGRSLRAGGWTLTQALSFKVLQLVSNLILTRILFPEAFGIMALVTVFVGGLSMISDVGIRPALIRSNRANEPVFQSTSWTLQIVRGLLLMVLAWVLAWPYAALYDSDLIGPLIAVMALSPMIAGLSSIQIYLHERKLDIARVAAMHIGSKFLGVCVTVLLAWWLQSVWALVWGALFVEVLKTLLSHLLFPSPHHRLSWDKSVLSEILVFGRWIMLGTLLTYLGGQGLQAVQGVLVELETLAYLAIAGQFSWMIGELATAVLRGVAFPALSEVYRERPEDFRRLVRRVHRVQLSCTLPGLLILSFLGVTLIDILYDDRYATAGVFLKFLALNGAIAVTPMAFSSMLLALGDSRAFSFLAGINAALRIAGTLAGFLIGDVIGMIVGLGVGSAVSGAMTCWVARRHGVSDLRTVIPAMALILAVYLAALAGVF